MKIGIVTLPLHFNYGGILQAFALQKALHSIGFEAVLLTEKPHNFKNTIKRLLYNNTSYSVFIRKHIKTLALNYNFSTNELLNNQINTLVVGSDQVWRPSMGANRIHNINRFFLNTDSDGIRKIAYAASFGVDYWAFKKDEECLAKKLIKDFSSISVREESGISICSNFLQINSVKRVLDPTMLLPIEIYKEIIDESPYKTNKKHCFTYILDYESKLNKELIDKIIPKDSEILSAIVEKKVINKYLKKGMRVEDWLSAIFYSDIMITDSFHGCVFSILFKTNFYVMNNSVGGNTRIESLLKTFGLTNRLISKDNLPQRIEPINWVEVEEILLSQRQDSLNFLINSLING